jgi:hypothetical protein
MPVGEGPVEPAPPDQNAAPIEKTIAESVL